MKPYFVWSGGQTPNYVKMYFRLPQQHVPKRVWQLRIVEKLRRGGIVAGPPEVFGGGTERVGPGFSARTAGIWRLLAVSPSRQTPPEDWTARVLSRPRSDLLLLSSPLPTTRSSSDLSLTPYCTASFPYFYVNISIRFLRSFLHKP